MSQIDDIENKLFLGLLFKGWICAPELDKWQLESYGVRLGTRVQDKWINCWTTFEGLVKINQHASMWVWELYPIGDHN